MLEAKIPSYLSLYNPQTAKDDSILETDLLDNRVFRGTILEMDSALNLPYLGSLGLERQYSSVVFSLAAHRALKANLVPLLHPGGQREPVKVKRKVIGHSVGENLMLVDGEAIDSGPMAEILELRERITTGHLVGLEDIPDLSRLKDSIGTAVTFLVAVLNADPYLVAERIKDVKGMIGGKFETAMANYNSYRQGVVGFKVPSEAEAREAIQAFKALFPDIPGIATVRLKVGKAFHTHLLAAEGELLRAVLAFKGMRKYFRDPNPEIEIYSPLLNRRIVSADDSYYLVGHQLDELTVQFIESLASVPKEGLIGVVTTDVTEKIVPIVKDNIGPNIPVHNIKDKASLDEATENLAREFLEAA